MKPRIQCVLTQWKPGSTAFGWAFGWASGRASGWAFGAGFGR